MSETESNVIERPLGKKETMIASQLAMITKHVMNTSDVDHEKVQTIKEELSNGRYRTISERIAAKMFAEIEMA